VTSPLWASRLLDKLGHTESCRDIRRALVDPEGIIQAFRADEAFVLARGAKLCRGHVIYFRCDDRAPLSPPIVSTRSKTPPLALGGWPRLWRRSPATRRSAPVPGAGGIFWRLWRCLTGHHPFDS
jgi:hypothetical protein